MRHIPAPKHGYHERTQHFRLHLTLMTLTLPVITGLGALVGRACGANAFWEEMSSGKAQFSFQEGLAVDPVLVGKVQIDVATLLQPEVLARAARCVHLGLIAAREALDQAGLPGDTSDHRIGICLGSGLGGLDFHEEMIAKALQEGMRAIHPFTVPKVMPSALGSWIAQQTGITGPNLCISTACSSSANALAEGFWKIATGQWDMALVGGAEAPLSPFNYHAYKQLKVISAQSDPLQPGKAFHPRRDGFILAEGAGFLLLESLESARRRGAPVLARLSGVAQNSGAYHPVAPKPDASDIIAVMHEALACAGLAAEEIDALCAHGTGTLKNDEVEYLGMHSVFGEDLGGKLVMAPKNQIGHSLGACGILESILCVQALMKQQLPQAFQLQEGMIATESANRQAPLRAILKNSFGFGSNNVSLVFSRHQG